MGVRRRKEKEWSRHSKKKRTLDRGALSTAHKKTKHEKNPTVGSLQLLRLEIAKQTDHRCAHDENSSSRDSCLSLDGVHGLLVDIIGNAGVSSPAATASQPGRADRDAGVERRCRGPICLPLCLEPRNGWQGAILYFHVMHAMLSKVLVLTRANRARNENEHERFP